MTEDKEQWVVFLPDGTPLMGTLADDSQTAMARGMRMDLPAGCRVGHPPAAALTADDRK